MICPHCKTNLEGDLIYETFFEQYKNEKKAIEIASMYGATKTKGRWGRQISIYNIEQDRPVTHQCPDCGKRWGR